MELCEKCLAYFQTKSGISVMNRTSCMATTLKSRIFKMSFKSCVLLLTFVLLCVCFRTVASFNVDVKNAKTFTGPSGIYFGYSVAMLRNDFGNWLLVGAPKSYDPLQPGVKSPGVLFRCPIEGDITTCTEVIVDTTGNVQVSGIFYGNAKVFLHDKNDQWLGVAVDVAPSNNKVAVCAHRWKDAKFVARSDLLYMQGLCYELDSNFQTPARLIPILVDYNSLVHTIERYPIWAYGALGQSVEYTKVGDSLVMGTPGLNDWQGGFVIEDNFRANFTVMPEFEERNNWLLGYTITTAHLDRSNIPYIVAGAPRANQNGAVYIFQYKKTESLPEPLAGDQMGSFFGSVLCAADVNGDSLDDLLVGAPMFSTNNTEEGRVYVYINNNGSLRLERQEAVLNGSRQEQARFGSAISSIGDINKDGFNDIAIGAPYENEGAGALYIYNGYNGGVWEIFSQHIQAKDVDSGLRAFGAALSLRPLYQSNWFGVGAYDSDKAIVFKSRPVVAMETRMDVTPARITATGPYIDLVTCFRYTGASGTLPNTLELEYTMKVDTTTPEGFVRALVMSSNKTTESRTLVIRRAEFVCDRSVRIAAPYKNIWRDVEIEVEYDLLQQSSGGPILEKFNGRNPGASLQNSLKRTIQYDKQCGEDNICDTELTMKIKPLIASGGYVISGDAKRLEVKVDLGNLGENAYNIMLDMLIYGNLSMEELRTQDTGQALVDCALNSYEVENNPLYRCFVRQPYPLKKDGGLSFTLLFPLDSHIKLGEFGVDFSLRTAEEDTVHVAEALRVKILVDYTIGVKGISRPEQVTLDLQDESQLWSEIVHKYSVKNRGPSPLENKDIHVYVPAIVHNTDELIADTYVELTLYNADPPTKLTCPPSTKPVQIPDTHSSGGYAISVDCSTFKCRSFACSIRNLKKEESVLITVSMAVSRYIIATLQARDSVRLASRIAIPAADKTMSEDEVVTMFHKTSTDVERKKTLIPIWLVIVSVVSAFLILLVLVAILVKVGFFKRKQKEELDRLKERRASRAWETPVGKSETGTSQEDKEPEVDTGHVNPLVDEMENDEVGYHNKDGAFMNDLSNNLKARHEINGYPVDDKSFD